MNTEITVVNIICPHCNKDSYKSMLLSDNNKSLLKVDETETKVCGNCGKHFSVNI